MLLHRLFSKRKSVILGLGLLTLGYGFLATQPEYLRWGLGFLVLGSGLFKAGIISMVGNLYLQKEQNERAFQWLYYAGTYYGSRLPPQSAEGRGWPR